VQRENSSLSAAVCGKDGALLVDAQSVSGCGREFHYSYLFLDQVLALGQWRWLVSHAADSSLRASGELCARVIGSTRQP
jgi:hypothetical protein